MKPFKDVQEYVSIYGMLARPTFTQRLPRLALAKIDAPSISVV